MHGIIIYKSRYGSTRQYAEWLRDAVGFALVDVEHAPNDLRAYDTVVIGASIMAGRLRLGKWIVRHWPELRDKTVYLMMVNITDDPARLATYVPTSVPDEIARALKVFPVPGRYQPSRMQFLDRTLINVVAGMTKDEAAKQELTTERDEVKRECLEPLVQAILGSGS